MHTGFHSTTAAPLGVASPLWQDGTWHHEMDGGGPGVPPAPGGKGDQVSLGLTSGWEKRPGEGTLLSIIVLEFLQGVGRFSKPLEGRRDNVDRFLSSTRDRL